MDNRFQSPKNTLPILGLTEAEQQNPIKGRAFWGKDSVSLSLWPYVCKDKTEAV